MKKSLLLLFAILCAFPMVGQSTLAGISLLRKHHPMTLGEVERTDLDGDGDWDLIRTTLGDSLALVWIDDDDDMGPEDREGDLDSDCLLLDRNGDGVFAGPGDLSLDWVDRDGNGRADMQVIVENGDPSVKAFWEWSSNYMWVIDDGEEDGQFHYVNWDDLTLRAWEHSGASNFYEDYIGETLFLKAHIPSYRFSDLRYSWENPFLFYDPDGDGLSEATIRMEDLCRFEAKKGTEVDAYPTGRIEKVYMGFDLDNDNGPGNEFDFDLGMQFSGPGFAYDHHVHRYEGMRGLPEANSLFYDGRWRQMDELIFPTRDSAWELVFRRGDWESCWFTFDEDDDCERWERVELYQPRSPFLTGMNGGGIDHNPQADAGGDRGEWDQDNSGGGKLYIGFDGKIHLFGAETGHWRLDPDASSYQGWGGLYAGQYVRDQADPERFATLSYEDGDGDGFFDVLRCDLDGDTLYEATFRLGELGISCQSGIHDTGLKGMDGLNRLFHEATEQNWDRALAAVEAAEVQGIHVGWYARYLHPRSAAEKYRYAWELQFYLFTDLLRLAENTRNADLEERAIRAYFSGAWRKL
ncbi:MAG: hypothetical protein R2751_10335 [Bacteroidales bacterium]